MTVRGCSVFISPFKPCHETMYLHVNLTIIYAVLFICNLTAQTILKSKRYLVRTACLYAQTGPSASPPQLKHQKRTKMFPIRFPCGNLFVVVWRWIYSVVHNQGNKQLSIILAIIENLFNYWEVLIEILFNKK